MEEFKAAGAGAERKGDEERRGGWGWRGEADTVHGGGPLHCEPHFGLDFMTFLKIEV